VVPHETVTEKARRVLVIEDEAGLRTVVARVLEHAGYQVTTAANGLVALSVLDGDVPDVILLDLSMPIMDGFEFRAQQLLIPHLATIPVIVVSGDKDLAAKASALRPRAWLAKPFDLDEVVDIVAEACAA